MNSFIKVSLRDGTDKTYLKNYYMKKGGFKFPENLYKIDIYDFDEFYKKIASLQQEGYKKVVFYE